MTGISTLTQTVTSLSQTLTQLPPVHRVTSLFNAVRGNGAFWSCALLSSCGYVYGGSLLYDLVRYPPLDGEQKAITTARNHAKQGKLAAARAAIEPIKGDHPGLNAAYNRLGGGIEAPAAADLLNKLGASRTIGTPLGFLFFGTFFLAWTCYVARAAQPLVRI